LIEIEYHGEKLPVKNGRVILALETARETLINIQLNCERINASYVSHQEDQIIEMQDQNLESYISLFSLYDEALKFLSKDKEDPVSLGEGQKCSVAKL
jgi:methyl coenzyme M reductase subunit D